MSNLIIIHPGGAGRTYGPLAGEFAAVEPPLWARLIAGYVRDRGHGVSIIDAEALYLGSKEVAALVAASSDPHLVCITAYGHQPSASTQAMPAVYEIARAIKAVTRQLPIIVVGGHVSALPKQTLREEPAVDYVCVGEGPITVCRMLDNDPLASIPGLGRRIVSFRMGDHGLEQDGERYAINPPTPLISDLHQLHGNVWDLLPMDRYRAHNWQCLDDMERRQPYASVYTSLGCAYKCEFCCIHAPFQSHRYRMRDPAAVVTEIEMLHRRYGVSTFKITDEMFLLNERHYTAVAKGLIDTGIVDLNIWAYARVDTVKPHTLRLLRAAGIQWLALGIESGSEHVRDGAAKSLSGSDIVDIVYQIRQAGINVIANYIFGLPDDDGQTMGMTLRLACDLNTEWANFYSAMAYPGSPLYTQAIHEGWRLPAAWSGYSQHSADCRPLDTKHVSGVAVLAFRDEAFHSYYSSPDYLNMIAAKFGPAAVDHIQAMSRFQLRRELLEDMEAA